MQAIPEWKNALKSLIYALGKVYVISPRNHAEGMEICRALHGLSIPTTLGKLSKSGDDPLEIVHEYQLLSNAFSGIFTDESFYLSIKPPALDFSSGHASAIAATALRNGHGIHLDAHEYADTDVTLGMLQDLMKLRDDFCGVRGGATLGVTLPSRWKRSIADAEWIAGKRLRVRLVKGEFGAPSSCEKNPAFGFLELIDLLVGRVPEIAVATHDRALAQESVARCLKAGSKVVLELLFGMPVGGMMALSREMGVPVRFYVPYGENLLIYGIAHFLKNPRKLFRRHLLEVLASHRSKLDRIAASV